MKLLRLPALAVESIVYLFIFITAIIFSIQTFRKQSYAYAYHESVEGPLELLKNSSTNFTREWAEMHWKDHNEPYFAPARYPFFLVHMLASPFFLVFGLFQFIESLRTRYLSLHRLMGKVYFYTNILSSVSGICLSFITTRPHVAPLGVVFGIVSLLTLFMAIAKVKKHQIESHRIWMIRNYAVGYGVYVIRLVFVPLFLINGFDAFADRERRDRIVATSFYIGWIGAVALNELYILIKFSKTKSSLIKQA